MPVEIDLHRGVSRRGNLEPVFADIQLAAAVATFPGFTPGAQNSRNLQGSASPHEFTWESRLAEGHARGIPCGTYRSDNFTDESFRHDHSSEQEVKKERKNDVLYFVKRQVLLKMD
jgi:hypothetical protein